MFMYLRISDLLIYPDPFSQFVLAMVKSPLKHLNNPKQKMLHYLNVPHLFYL